MAALLLGVLFVTGTAGAQTFRRRRPSARSVLTERPAPPRGEAGPVPAVAGSMGGNAVQAAGTPAAAPARTEVSLAVLAGATIPLGATMSAVHGVYPSVRFQLAIASGDLVLGASLGVGHRNDEVEILDRAVPRRTVPIEVEVSTGPRIRVDSFTLEAVARITYMHLYTTLQRTNGIPLVTEQDLLFLGLGLTPGLRVSERLDVIADLVLLASPTVPHGLSLDTGWAFRASAGARLRF
ncbi:MAG: hypothetical protein Q8M65_09525 [Rhodoglobus sp.]|nr:hypothetical protein [Rhodoglobus sp.]